MRTVVYVDGYNLYYGLLRKTTLKWLDLFALFRDHVLDPEADLVEVRYYTAPVLGRMCDDQESPQRQRRYLQALRKMYPTQITIIEVKIIATTPFQRLVKPIAEAPDLQMVQVYDFNEKKTDVNLAADLIAGAWTGAYEQAVCAATTRTWKLRWQRCGGIIPIFVWGWLHRFLVMITAGSRPTCRGMPIGPNR